MKICKVCLSSDLLCSGCSRKLDEGMITKTDIALSRALHEINQKSDFIEAFEENGRLFLIVDTKHTKEFIGPGGKNIRKLSEALGKPIKLMEKATGTEKHIIEKLSGAPVLGINKVYSNQKASKENTSGESFKVRVERRYVRNVQPLAGVVGKILNKKVSFVFE